MLHTFLFSYVCVCVCVCVEGGGVEHLCACMNVCKRERLLHFFCFASLCTLIIMYIYHTFINALSAHMIHINLNMIFYTHVGHSPTQKCTKYYMEEKKMCYTHTTVAETGS